ncbi:MAG: ADP-ribosylation factor-like protein [candidate division KSB1 bacterium]|nr:ADP-ribosylation factor-like protein [candidate division KSB1 bacterium]MDZ7273079.1 ADP-ribosylation factor-like protein [candidate division KSB1 bacterium]MDZ7285182.1 ADP-ribosylation factor-like protein [candidate division KSB1 bacterium]MDZ7298214.1 ADP-ribosylation factor-like protein [candidate division KSB1 bacterium]MDZ7306888.1 ADP-ribosylation factor-like protein [candidate division KSB1 bacterium]
MSALQKKICLLGTFGVGKTSLVRRFVENHFDDKYLSTIGVKVSRKHLVAASRELDLLVWDLANAEELGPLEKNYFRGAHGALVVHDLTRPESCARLAAYCERFLALAPRARLVFAGNKLDLLDTPPPSPQAYQAFTAGFSAPHFFTSAKTGAQVEQAFHALAEAILAAP